MNLHSQAWGVIQQTLKQVPSGCADGSLPRLRCLTWLWLSGTCTLHLPANPLDVQVQMFVLVSGWGLRGYLFISSLSNSMWMDIEIQLKMYQGRPPLFVLVQLLEGFGVWVFFFLPAEITLGIKGSIIWANELVEFPVLLRSHLPTPSF